MGEPRLITILVSHYCEKARWGLDHSGIAYTESGHIPIFHALAVKRAGGAHTVPVLVTDSGLVPESSDILKWADAHRVRGSALWPERHAEAIAQWVGLFDKDVGPTTRVVGYDQLLPDRRLAQTIGAGAPAWERRLLRAFYPLFARLLRRGLVITPERVVRAQHRLGRTFDAVDAALADGREFLVGDTFSAADLTWASLVAPAVFPDGYGGAFPPFEALPDGYRGQVEAYRMRPAGQFALRLYREHRRR